ncbi:PTS sugar transporter subunit IIB [Levilactobacillus fujinensis]|uniref:Cellobiose PTS IIC subunit n=1 Tax=Levilactobacillus fujinensis TaxID=2486024 RepID=A0ABW1TCZ0_9LACO|nr:cellobiose PTS IIC subunit [Levilactobacillus fujinensis]
MKNVLLVSGKGNCGHLFLGEAKRIAETRKVPLRFSAVSSDDVTSELVAEQDLVLLVPQDGESLQISSVAPVVEIPNDIYGWLNGEALVKFACRQLDQKAVVA